MDTYPIVSVLLSSYNNSQYLSPAIESILKQTYDLWELIIVDDGSSDESWDIIGQYAARDARIKALRSKENLGASAALNLALQVAKGEYITRQDSDDLALPERLEKQLDFLNEHPEIGAVGCNVIYINADGNETGVSEFPLTDDMIQPTLVDRMCFCGPTVMARRACFQQAGFYFVDDLKTAEDYDLCLRLAEVTRLANIEEPLYFYRQHTGSVSISKRQFQLINKARSLEQAIQRRFGANSESELYQIVARDYLRAAVVGCAGGDLQSSRVCLSKALHYHSNILNAFDLEEIILRYLPKFSIKASLDYLRNLFEEVLPRHPSLKHLKSKLMAQVYIESAFAREKMGASNMDQKDLIWRGVRYNPAWLFNRGVVSILVKSLFRGEH